MASPIDDFSLTPTGTIPPPNLTINDVSVTEGPTGNTVLATFTVSLSTPAPAGGVTFDIATADGTATTADADYVTRSLTGQTISAGNTSYTFDVTVNGDSAIESNETVPRQRDRHHRRDRHRYGQGQSAPSRTTTRCCRSCRSMTSA